MQHITIEEIFSKKVDEKHVAQCKECNLLYSLISKISRFAKEQKEERIQTTHISFEELEKYLFLEEENKEISEHLFTCGICFKKAISLQHEIELFNGMENFEVPPNLEELISSLSKHPCEADIEAYINGELQKNELLKIANHIQGIVICLSCALQMHLLKKRVKFLGTRQKEEDFYELELDHGKYKLFLFQSDKSVSCKITSNVFTEETTRHLIINNDYKSPIRFTLINGESEELSTPFSDINDIKLLSIKELLNE